MERVGGSGWCVAARHLVGVRGTSVCPSACTLVSGRCLVCRVLRSTCCNKRLKRRRRRRRSDDQLQSESSCRISLTYPTAKQLPDQFDEIDSEAVAGYERHQRLSVASRLIADLLQPPFQDTIYSVTVSFRLLLSGLFSSFSTNPRNFCQTTCLPTHLPLPTLPTGPGGRLSRPPVP